MACDLIRNKTLEARKAAAAALADLDAKIASGALRLVRDARGRVAVIGWAATAAAASGWCDGCALRAISAAGSWAAKAKLAAAGVVAGKAFVSAGHDHHDH